MQKLRKLVMTLANLLRKNGMTAKMALTTAWAKVKSGEKMQVTFAKETGELREATAKMIGLAKRGTIRFIENIGGKDCYRAFVCERVLSIK